MKQYIVIFTIFFHSVLIISTLSCNSTESINYYPTRPPQHTKANLKYKEKYAPQLATLTNEFLSSISDTSQETLVANTLLTYFRGTFFREKSITFIQKSRKIKKHRSLSFDDIIITPIYAYEINIQAHIVYTEISFYQFIISIGDEVRTMSYTDLFAEKIMLEAYISQQGRAWLYKAIKDDLESFAQKLNTFIIFNLNT